MIEILKALPREGGDNSLIFEGTKAGRPLGRNALSKIVGTMGVDCTVHGFRSSFKDWCSEMTAFPRELAEHALAHEVGNAVERAYGRSKLIEKRRALMLQWERFCMTPLPKSKVIPIRKNA